MGRGGRGTRVECESSEGHVDQGATSVVHSKANVGSGRRSRRGAVSRLALRQQQGGALCYILRMMEPRRHEGGLYLGMSFNLFWVRFKCRSQGRHEDGPKGNKAAMTLARPGSVLESEPTAGRPE